MSDPSTNDDGTDVADAEAEAIAEETSAESFTADDRLTAPTTEDGPESA
ncbi:hypothetical protein BH18ACT2_BH18ACT2_07670 [soil metagenome]